jgi:hypothetical protein
VPAGVPLYCGVSVDVTVSEEPYVTEPVATSVLAMVVEAEFTVNALEPVEPV